MNVDLRPEASDDLVFAATFFNLMSRPPEVVAPVPFLGSVFGNVLTQHENR